MRRTSSSSGRRLASSLQASALFASGFEAVMGGMLVASLTYIIWGFIAYRFVQKAGTTRPGVSAPAGQPVRA